MFERFDNGTLRFYPQPARNRRQVRAAFNIAISIAIIAFIEMLTLFVAGAYMTAIGSLLVLIGAVAGVFLHRRGRHLSARLILLSMLNLGALLGSLTIHPDSNYWYHFYLYVGLPFLVLSWRDNRALVLAFAILPIICWLILQATNFGNLAYVEVGQDQAVAYRYVYAAYTVIFVLLDFTLYNWIAQRYDLALRKALRAEKKAGRSKTAFLSSMSHEIRTPLNAVIGASELLQNHPDAPPEIRRTAEAICSAGLDILAQTERTTALTRLLSGSVQAVPQEVNPNYHVGQAIERLQDDIALKEIKVKIIKAEGIRVLADPAMLTEALFHLIDRAISNATQGGQIRIELISGDKIMRLSVSDNGPNIPVRERENLFRFDEPLDTSFNLGADSRIGMAIAGAYAKAMNGRIGVGTGKRHADSCELWIDLPIAGQVRISPAAA
ncbi:HAMP domain-containing sensor histidine kinase [Thalassovita sp.]|uniref:sensor histidine kinase n=1 Tax=Thalassovita sp. TaxID=1979401 RepID=UPI002B26AD24|nr:HAMP domain-containing sensor histidine kinase [Thalassovita sp.]